MRQDLRHKALDLAREEEEPDAQGSRCAERYEAGERRFADGRALSERLAPATV